VVRVRVLTCLRICLVPVLRQVGKGYRDPLALDPTTPELLDPGFGPEDGVGVDDAEVGVRRSRQRKVRSGHGKVSSGDAVLISGPGCREQHGDVTELCLSDVIEPLRYRCQVNLKMKHQIIRYLSETLYLQSLQTKTNIAILVSTSSGNLRSAVISTNQRRPNRHGTFRQSLRLSKDSAQRKLR